MTSGVLSLVRAMSLLSAFPTATDYVFFKDYQGIFVIGLLPDQLGLAHL